MIEKDGYKVPLIGINPSAVLETCDCCHDEFGLRTVEIQEDGQILCVKCKKNYASTHPKSR